MGLVGFMTLINLGVMIRLSIGKIILKCKKRKIHKQFKEDLAKSQILETKKKDGKKEKRHPKKLETIQEEVVLSEIAENDESVSLDSS